MVGVDGCPSGWLAMAVQDAGPVGLERHPDFAAVLRAYAAAGVIAVDVAIGLPSGGPRRADLEARRFLGPRAASLFLIPRRQVLEAPSYEAARAIARRLTGKAISAQTYAFGRKVLEVDRALAGHRPPPRVFEVHPEVSFRALAGRAIPFAKRTAQGQGVRRFVLQAEGLDPLERWSPPPGVKPDDCLDAAVAAWTALRIARGEAQSLPHPPEELDGRPVAIWH